MAFGISSDPETTRVLDSYPVLREFCERLHGSGIDFDWHAEETKNHVKLYNAFHCMNEAGFYVAAQNFAVTMPKRNVLDFRVTCSDKSRYWWNACYLGEILPNDVSFALSEAIKALDNKPPIESGFRREEIIEIFPVKRSGERP